MIKIITINYKYILISLLTLLATNATASSSSVSVATPKVVVWHSGLEWTPGSAKAQAASVACDSSEATSDATQTMVGYTHHYIKDIRKNGIKVPIGWNYTSTTTTNTPQYGVNCKKLQTKLKFYKGKL